MKRLELNFNVLLELMYYHGMRSLVPEILAFAEIFFCFVLFCFLSDTVHVG